MSFPSQNIKPKAKNFLEQHPSNFSFEQQLPVNVTSSFYLPLINTVSKCTALGNYYSVSQDMKWEVVGLFCLSHSYIMSVVGACDVSGEKILLVY